MARADYKRKLLDLIECECGASLMNNTKWMETLCLVNDLRLLCRMKLLTDPEVTRWQLLWSPAPPAYIEGSGMWPVLALEIEWLEIDPYQRRRRGALVADEAIDRRHDLETGLQALGVPCIWVGAAIRIMGHVRRQVPP